MIVQNVDQIFRNYLPKKLEKKLELKWWKINIVYKFIVQGKGGGTWLLDLTVPEGKITRGDGDAKCILTLSSDDLVAIVNGDLNLQMAFMAGRLKIDGDLSDILLLFNVSNITNVLNGEIITVRNFTGLWKIANDKLCVNYHKRITYN